MLTPDRIQFHQAQAAAARQFISHTGLEDQIHRLSSALLTYELLQQVSGVDEQTLSQVGDMVYSDYQALINRISEIAALLQLSPRLLAQALEDRHLGVTDVNN